MLEDILSKIDEASAGIVSSAFTALGGMFYPLAQSFMAIAIIFFGIGMWFGIVNHPVADFAKKSFLWIACITVMKQWLYFDVLIYTLFTDAPDEIGIAILGSITPGLTSDTVTGALSAVLEKGIIAAGAAFSSDGFILPFVIGTFIFIGAIAVVGYGLALIILAKVAMACVLSLGPLFILFLMFEPTRQMFSSWLQQLFNFGFMAVLTYLVLTFFLKLIDLSLSYIPVDDPQIEHTVPIVLIGFAGSFVLAQIPSISSALAGGAQITTMGAVASASRMASRVRGGGIAQGGGRLLGKGTVKAGKFAWNAYKNRRNNKISRG